MSIYAARNQSIVFVAALVLLVTALPASLSGQSAVSVRPAMIHLAEGQVTLRGFAEHLESSGRYRHLAEGQRLILQDGRAEIFLNLGTTMRVGGHSEVEMVKADVDDIQVRLVQGAAMFELRDERDMDAVSVLAGDATVRFDKKGLYRIDHPSGGLPRLKVFQGSTTVLISDQRSQVQAKQSLLLAGAPERGKIERLNRSPKDALDRWQRERAQIVAQDRRAKGADGEQSEAEEDLLQNVYRAERDAAAGPRGRRNPIGGPVNNSGGRGRR